MQPPAFRSDRSWRFDARRDVVWEKIAATDDYLRWWPWLRRFEGGAGLVGGERWTCEVSPPLPYVVRFEIHLDRVDPGRAVDSTIRGDIVGSASLRLDPGATGTRVRLVSDLRPSHPLLRGFGRVARPLVERGHDWVLDEGRRQFVDRAFE